MSRAVPLIASLLLVCVTSSLAACDSSNVLQRYTTCLSPMIFFIASTNPSVSACLQMYEEVNTCVDDFRYDCGNGSIAKWFEYSYETHKVTRVANYTCVNLDVIRSSRTCIGVEKARTFISCSAQNMKVADFCMRTNENGACLWHMYSSCPASTRKVAMVAFDLGRSHDCKSHGRKAGEIGASLTVLMALISVVYNFLL